MSNYLQRVKFSLITVRFSLNTVVYNIHPLIKKYIKLKKSTKFYYHLNSKRGDKPVLVNIPPSPSHFADVIYGRPQETICSDRPSLELINKFSKNCTLFDIYYSEHIFKISKTLSFDIQEKDYFSYKILNYISE